MRHALRLSIPALAIAASLGAQAPSVPDWAQPGSATHRQVPPPRDYHKATVSWDTPLGVFAGQSDVGGAVVPGGASFDAASGRYTIDSAGYNIWYTRDEFRYLWRRMSGDVSLAADATFPNPGGYGDRKVVLVIRQDLDDDSKEIMAGLHGAGLIHLALRPVKGADIKEDCRVPGRAGAAATRIGIEKRGDSFTLYVSQGGEPLHQAGPAVSLHFDGPFYVGVGFCSHLPATSDTGVVSRLVLEGGAGRVR